MKKRITTPVAKPGELIARWGRVDRHSAPSIVYAYPDRSGKSDSRVLCDAIEGPRCSPSSTPFGGYDVNPSLVEELESRGYDITTLRISIKKKTPPDEQN